MVRERPALEIQSKLLIMLLSVSVASTAVVGTFAVLSGREQLRDAVVNQLITVREQRAREVEHTLGVVMNGLILDSRNGTTVAASRDFNAAFAELQSVGVTPDQQAELESFYADVFVPQLADRTQGGTDPELFLPDNRAQAYLQAHYVPPDLDYESALAVEDAGDGSRWSQFHAQYHDTFRELVNRLGYEDVLLLDTEGNAVYSAFKGVDLGTNVHTGPFAGGFLEDAYTRALHSTDIDSAVITDFERYRPSLGVPNLWIASPVGNGSEITGVLAVQIGVDTLNEVMTDDGHWSEDGLGETGEVYLVGPDHLMRSTARLLLENPEEYERRVVEAGTDPSIAARQVFVNGTVLLQPVRTDAVELALQSKSGTMLAEDYDGRDSIIAYAPVQLEGIHWAIIAVETQDEAFAPTAEFTRNLLLVLVGIVLAVSLLSLLLAQVFTRPLRSLSAAVRRLAAGETGVEVQVASKDEFGDLGTAFNDMSRSLQLKADLLSEQQAENERLLHNLMPESVARRYQDGEETIAEDHQDVAVVYGEVVGASDYFSSNDSNAAVGLINSLVRGFDEAADRLGVERVRTLRDGYLASCGLVVPRVDNVRRAVDFAIEMTQIVERFNATSGTSLGMRAGVDAGTVSSGLVAREHIAYDLWGDAVDVANAVRSVSAEPGVFVSDRVHERLRDAYGFEEAGRMADGTAVWRYSAEPTEPPATKPRAAARD